MPDGERPITWNEAVAKYGHARIEQEARDSYESYARVIPLFTEWEGLSIPAQTGWSRVAVDVLERHAT